MKRTLINENDEVVEINILKQTNNTNNNYNNKSADLEIFIVGKEDWRIHTVLYHGELQALMELIKEYLDETSISK